MAREAEQLLAGTGWLPAPLRLAPICSAVEDGDQHEPEAQMTTEPSSIVLA